MTVHFLWIPPPKCSSLTQHTKSFISSHQNIIIFFYLSGILSSGLIGCDSRLSSWTGKCFELSFSTLFSNSIKFTRLTSGVENPNLLFLRDRSVAFCTEVERPLFLVGLVEESSLMTLGARSNYVVVWYCTPGIQGSLWWILKIRRGGGSRMIRRRYMKELTVDIIKPTLYSHLHRLQRPVTCQCC